MFQLQSFENGEIPTNKVKEENFVLGGPVKNKWGTGRVIH